MNLEFSSWDTIDPIYKCGTETGTTLPYHLCCNINSFKDTLKASDDFKNK